MASAPKSATCLAMAIVLIVQPIAKLMLEPISRSIVPEIKAAEPDDTNYDEARVPRYSLPDPLINLAGAPITTAEQWHTQRRPEILRLFEESVYGATPRQKLNHVRFEVQSVDNQALDGKATRKQIAIYLTENAEPRIDLLLYIPNQRSGRVPCFAGLNFYGNQTVHADPGIAINPRWMRDNPDIGIVDHRATEATLGTFRHRWQVERLIERGYALATAYYGDLDPDNYQHDFSDGVHPLFYRVGQSQPDPQEWGSIGAWAWGLSRILDYLETDARIDGKRVAVVGLSRLGKTALRAGAQDERFAMVISTNSGCGGAALYRRHFGEQIHHMIKPIGYWFCRAHADYAHREAELPVDQHMLLALIAPRPLYVASATQDRWADPQGEFLAAVGACPVYQLLGWEGLPSEQFPPPDQPLQGRIGYHLRTGEHDMTPYDWEQYLDFADKQL